MATLHTPGQNPRHDGQRNYQGSNERNRDNVRNDTRDHQYEDFDDARTNDALFEEGKGPTDIDDRDHGQNLSSQDATQNQKP